MRQVNTTYVAQFHTFELLPDTLVRVQLRGIGRQALHVEAVRYPIREEVFDDLTAVDRRAIPNEYDPARHLPQQVLEKGDDVAGIQSVALAMEIQLPLRGDGADGGEMVTGPPLPQDGCLPDRRLGAHRAGEGIKTGFIQEEDRLRLRLRPLLSVGHVSARQCAMAASLRCRARRTGF
jgi:hypothetical protein